MTALFVASLDDGGQTPPDSPVPNDLSRVVCADPSGECSQIKLDNSYTGRNETSTDNNTGGHSARNLFVSPSGEPLSPNLLKDITLFRRKQEKGFVDVWWLFDDGGNPI